MTDPILLRAIAQIAEARSTGRVPVVRSFFDEATFTASHVVHDPVSKKAAIIDSVLDFDQASGRTSHASADAIIAHVREAGLDVEWQIETHAHADHLSAAPYLIEVLGGKLVIGRDITTVQTVFGGIFNEDARFARDGSQFDQLVADGDRFTLGNIAITVLHTPGHTPACMSWLIGDALFVGDTLFMPDYGTARADFPGGDARTLFRSIRRLLALPPETRLFLCHDYKAPGRDTFAWESSIGAQREQNIHVHDTVEEDAFVAMREARDATLGMPRLILPSIQVNMRGGHFPEPEANGTRYLKLPLDIL
ncbi:MBL fold metallo-hydrolase [Sphingomonas lacunae]|uniref:MBL fold metallo-hydrolase n=1 Tax=Sphingomonas lacunae TaxID=2698828 RepID=A0A6M4AQ09_9SPHN|nr:MBL fold metallo-hydrolase [Sphingomonas lacunae]QJQ31164.1 MBL fold metallo-hydrolase [Sphingomonas lacunae]